MLTLFASMFLVGLVTSVHCISMCGPMVVTYAIKSEGEEWYHKITPNFVYQLSKLFSYTAIGLALGAVGGALNLSAIQPWAMLLAGTFMLIIGLGMTGKVPWAQRLMPRPPKFLLKLLGTLRRRSKNDSGNESLATSMAFGLLTGLMPCAPLIAAEVAAASGGSMLAGGVTMFAFGLGTMPLLFSFGVTASIIPKKWKEYLSVGLAFVVIIMGFVFLNRSALLLGSPINSTAIMAKVLGDSSVLPTYEVKSGTTIVPLTIEDLQYKPATLRVPANTRIKIVVTRNEDNACSAQLAFPQLGVTKNLKPNGVTEIVLPEVPPGSYTMTCGMGMMSGQLVAVKK